MSWFFDLIDAIGGSFYPYMAEISTAMVACTLVVLHNDIQGFVRSRISRWPFVFRTLAYVLLIAFGYGLLITWLSPWLAGQLKQLNPDWLLLTIVTGFSIIGLWAERNKQI